MTNIRFMNDRRYHALDYELKKVFGKKLYKLALNGGMSCPNRDGTLGSRGCIFCSEGGSGDFAASKDMSVSDQINMAKELIAGKLPLYQEIGYIAYFQAYTNTYAPIEYLDKLFREALRHPEICVLSIATRPDCINEATLMLLKELNLIKPLWIELGLQTMHEATAQFIRRGYSLQTFEDIVRRLHDIGINIIVHTILGLPGETKDNMLQTMDYISKLPVQGIKLQLLHILKGTDLGDMYEADTFNTVLTMDEYIDIVIACLERLPKDIVIHRITGDGPGNQLLAPLWSRNKKLVLNRINHELKARNTWQGRCCAITNQAK